MSPARILSWGEKRAWERAIMASEDLNAAEKLVGWSLAQRFNTTTGQCNPSVDRIMRDTALSRRSVQGGIGGLIRKRRIAPVAGRRGGAAKSTEFRLLLSSAAQLVAAFGGVTGDATPLSIDSAAFVEDDDFDDPETAQNLRPSTAQNLRPFGDEKRAQNLPKRAQTTREKGADFAPESYRTLKESTGDASAAPVSSSPNERSGPSDLSGSDPAEPSSDMALIETLLGKMKTRLGSARARAWLSAGHYAMKDGAMLIRCAGHAQFSWLVGHEAELRIAISPYPIVIIKPER